MEPAELSGYVSLLETLKTVAKEHTSKQNARALIGITRASVETDGEVVTETPKKIPPAKEAVLPPIPKEDKPKKAKPSKASDKPLKPAKDDKRALQEIFGSNPFEQKLSDLPAPPSVDLPPSAKRRKEASRADADRSGSSVLPDGEGQARRARRS